MQNLVANLEEFLRLQDTTVTTTQLYGYRILSVVSILAFGASLWSFNKCLLQNRASCLRALVQKIEGIEGRWVGPMDEQPSKFASVSFPEDVDKQKAVSKGVAYFVIMLAHRIIGAGDQYELGDDSRFPSTDEMISIVNKLERCGFVACLFRAMLVSKESPSEGLYIIGNPSEELVYKNHCKISLRIIHLLEKGTYFCTRKLNPNTPTGSTLKELVTTLGNSPATGDPVKEGLIRLQKMSENASKAAKLWKDEVESGNKIMRSCQGCLRKVEKLLYCAQCNAAGYCSEECQRADWKSHKKFCHFTNVKYAVRRESGNDAFLSAFLSDNRESIWNRINLFRTEHPETMLRDIVVVVDFFANDFTEPSPASNNQFQIDTIYNVRPEWDRSDVHDLLDKKKKSHSMGFGPFNSIFCLVRNADASFSTAAIPLEKQETKQRGLDGRSDSSYFLASEGGLDGSLLAIFDGGLDGFKLGVGASEGVLEGQAFGVLGLDDVWPLLGAKQNELN